MVKNLKDICILSGPNDEVDLCRAKTAINFYKNLENKVPFRILGAGPDLNLALEHYNSFKNKKLSEQEYYGKLENLDHHLELYKFLSENINEEIKTITKSVTLVQNVLYGFSTEKEGIFPIVTEPWHYQKFELIEKTLKQKGKISEDLEFFNVPSPDTEYYSSIKKLFSNIKTRRELIKI